jgi:phospholipase/lecithinase/hemolysin
MYQRFKSNRFIAATMAAGVISALNVARASDFGSMTIFGDSLSDVGNAYNSDLHLDPTSPYYNGRFSNGLLWVENLAADLSLAAPTPSTSSGKDYAYGGVHTGSGTTTEVLFKFPNIGTQISSYLSSNTPAANGLFVVWGGGNDFIDGQTNPSVPVNNIAAHVTALANAGAKTIIVPNLPALGEVPRFRGTSNESTMNNLSSQFDSMLQSTLTSLASSLKIHIDQLDVASLFSSAIANPSAYGFANVTATADNNGTVVSNPDQYLFWDDIHPTRIGHQMIASAAFDLVTTHNWVATGSASFGTASNWDAANSVDATWIANLQNTSSSPGTANVASNASVRQIHISGNSGGGSMTVSVQSGVTLSASQSVTIGLAGAINLQSSSTLNSPSISIQTGGFLSGTGTVSGSVSNSGIIAPTTSLNITGAFVQGSGGAIQINLAGTGSAQFSTLKIGQQATLGGNVSVNASPGFIPLPGESFSVLSFASRSGTATISNSTAYAGLRFNPSYTSTSLTLTADATAGDANLDGVIDSQDFDILAMHFNQTSQNWLSADFNHDGVVNALDFNELAANYGVAPAPLGAIVPEPVGVSLLLLGMLSLRRRDRRSATPNATAAKRTCGSGTSDPSAGEASARP